MADLLKLKGPLPLDASRLGVKSRTPFDSRLMDGNDEDNDNEDKIISSDETTSLSSSSSSSLPPLPEGEELAKQFYRQIRQRQGQQEKSTTEPDNRTAPILSEDQLRIQNAKPFSKRREMSVASSTSNSDRNVPPSQRKYTGQSDSPLFGNVPPGTRERSDPRRSMMEREFQLAGRGASLGLGVQAVFAVVVLTFYIYVGVSGGIVSGGGDYDFGGDDVIEYEQVIPVPRDLEKSVWL
ncbi:hypothetical protein IV203_005289 [Nitzschia inconspicua]|uniref:Uncharacterized protein n=1 Tax=Nitzschia inconspicua TaxID=303405 RepID=A0A9K3KMT1_9STRA|nr:hypothetical protein IV203_005289 [Nitzschia inconspicua]